MKFKYFFLCIFIAFIFYYPLFSYAGTDTPNKHVSVEGWNGIPNSENGYHHIVSFDINASYRVCGFINSYGNPVFFCNHNDDPIKYHVLSYRGGIETVNSFYGMNWARQTTNGYTFYFFSTGSSGNFPSMNNSYSPLIFSNVPVLSTMDEVIDYLQNGNLPELPFDETLELDYFKVSTYEEFFNAYAWDNIFKVGWSDSRISQVQVVISSTLRKDSFESSQSPFKSSFAGSTYAQTNGDVISLIATPYTSNGVYGPSLYYSFVYNSNMPLTNVWRKNHTYNFQDNTIQIPYTGVSGNDTVEVPVSGIKQDTCYKIYYNPTTEEITNENVYNIYYSPVIVYPENTPSEVIQETQETVINEYTTNNYYTTTNQINFSFNIDFEDISANDVQQTYDDVGGFFNGLGSFISKLVSIFQFLFPFLPDGLAAFIIIAFGIIALFVVVALAIKIAGVITNLLP